MHKSKRSAFRRFVWRSCVGFFGPLVMLIRMARKRRLNLIRQYEVLDRYISGRGSKQGRQTNSSGSMA